MNRKRLIFQYVMSDILASLIVWVVFMIFRKVVNDGLLFQGLWVMFPNYNFFTSLSVFPLLCLFVHYLSGSYIQPHKQSALNSILTTITASAFISIVIFFVLLIDDVVISYQHYYYSLLVLFGLQFVVTYAFRALVNSQVKLNYRTKRWTINTLIVGTEKMRKESLKNLSEARREIHLLVLCRPISNWLCLPKKYWEACRNWQLLLRIIKYRKL